ncbi:MAG: hypothetical protein WC600_12350 [Desulfobaccales bacterium]
MLEHNLHLDTRVTTDMTQLTLTPSSATPGDCRPSSCQFLAPLQPTIASWQRRFHQGVNQVIIRFHNGYGALISGNRLLEGIYEIAPLRFHGGGPDDYEHYFRSHVPDLTWSSDRDELVRVCEQISRLLPAVTV